MSRFSPNILGALCMMASMAGFIINDAQIKFVLQDLGLFQSITLRNVIVTVLLVGLCIYNRAYKTDGGLFRTLGHWSVIFRSVCEASATVFFLTALQYLPIANITAILQLLPLTITLGAALVYGETVGWRRYTAIFVGFFGVMLIIQPGGESFNTFSLYAIIAVLCVTMRDLVTRKVPTTTPTLLISIVTSIFILCLGLAGSAFEEWQPVTQSNWYLILGSAFALMFGYIFSVSAMRVGEVSFVAPFRYSIMIWALILGYLLFNEVPTTVESLGAIVVIGSGLFTFYRERLSARKIAIS